LWEKARFNRQFLAGISPFFEGQGVGFFLLDESRFGIEFKPEEAVKFVSDFALLKAV